MKRGSKSVTMKDVAAEAKLSTAAVSLALRGHLSIPEATRDRVLKIAAELGYRKNPLLMALTARRTGNRTDSRGVIAFLTNEPSASAFLGRTFYREFFEGARRQAKDHGYELELEVIASPDAAELQDRLDGMGCAACVIGAWDPSRPTPEIDWSRLAVVKIDSQFCGPDTVVVTNDNLHSVRLAYARLRELGYRRIGLATGSADELATNALYLAGSLIEAIGDDDASDIPALHFSPGTDFDEQSAELASWIGEYRVEAVISNWSGMVERLEARGLAVPRDVAFASLCLESNDGSMAGVNQQHRVVGELALDAVVARLEKGARGPDAAPREIFVKGVWCYGRTAPNREKVDA